MCEECYIDESRVTPLLNPEACLREHTQYICGTCGRCICIEKDKKRKIQRWNFPFRSLEIAKMYLRSADYTMKRCCGIYEIENSRGKQLYKIFVDQEELELYLKKHKDKRCQSHIPVFQMKAYKEFPHTQVRKLNEIEIEKYMKERQDK